MTAGRIGRAGAPACQESLQGFGGDTSVSQLVGSLGGGSEPLDRVAAPFGSLADHCQSRGFAGPGKSLQTLNAITGGEDDFMHSPSGRLELRVRRRTKAAQVDQNVPGLYRSGTRARSIEAGADLSRRRAAGPSQGSAMSAKLSATRKRSRRLRRKGIGFS